MIITKTNLDGAIIIEPQVFDDDRGYFFESYKSSAFLKYNLPRNFLQDNQVKSRKNALLNWSPYIVSNAYKKLFDEILYTQKQT